MVIGHIEQVRILGSGRGATAVLVKYRNADGTEKLAVEKRFKPPALTKFVYGLAFQAPFPYATNIHAINAAYFRRKVAKAIVESLTDGAVMVADALYTRYDPETKTHILGTQFVAGHLVKPETSEMGQLIRLMWKTRKALRQGGLFASGWQVDVWTSVASSNFLKDNESNKFVLVDLESGIPAVLTPYYLAAGLLKGSFPIFDDYNPRKLERWFHGHRAALEARVGVQKVSELETAIKELRKETELWKASELALGRRPWQVRKKWPLFVELIKNPIIFKMLLDFVSTLPNMAREIFRKTVEGVKILLSSELQIKRAKDFIYSSIEEEEKDQRIAHERAADYKAEMEKNTMAEYVKGLGWHTAIQLVGFFTEPIRWFGFTWFLLTLNPLGLVLFFQGALFRSGYVLKQILFPKNGKVPLFTALFVSLLPVVGNLAYPMQMRRTSPKFGKFIINSMGTEIAKRFPIYGGKGTITEFLGRRAIDGMVTFIDVVLWLSDRAIWMFSCGFYRVPENPKLVKK